VAAAAAPEDFADVAKRFFGSILGVPPGVDECWLPGELKFSLPLDGGGLLSVKAVASSEEPPPGAPPGSIQQWRLLSFEPDKGSTNLVQSITQVCIAPPGSVAPRVRLRGEVLRLEYTQSFVAVVLAALKVLGAPVLPVANGTRQETIRILCIGLGGGSMPAFFEQALPHCEVDVAENEPAVLQAALEGMGLVQGPRLRVAVEDGAAFALAAAGRSAEGAYDAVLVDAYDAAGNVPSELWRPGGGLARALEMGLLRRRGGVVATNFLPEVDPAPAFAAYRGALASYGRCRSFSVQSVRSENLIAVQTCSGGSEFAGDDEELRRQLIGAASEIGRAVNATFSMAPLAVRGLRSWLAPDEQAP